MRFGEQSEHDIISRVLASLEYYGMLVRGSVHHYRYGTIPHSDD